MIKHEGVTTIMAGTIFKAPQHSTWLLHIQAPKGRQRTTLRVKKGWKELGHNCDQKAANAR
jgi:hypothetical protein